MALVVRSLTSRLHLPVVRELQLDFHLAFDKASQEFVQNNSGAHVFLDDFLRYSEMSCAASENGTWGSAAKLSRTSKDEIAKL